MHHIIDGAPSSLKAAKGQAKRLRAALTNSTFSFEQLGHSQALELVAKTHSFESWGHMNAALAEQETANVKEAKTNLTQDHIADHLGPPIVNVTLLHMLREINDRTRLTNAHQDGLLRALTDALKDPTFESSGLRDAFKSPGSNMLNQNEEVSILSMVKYAPYEEWVQNMEMHPDIQPLPDDLKDLIWKTFYDIAVGCRDVQKSFGYGVNAPIGYFKNSAMVEMDIDKDKEPEWNRIIDRRHSLLIADSVDEARRAVHAVSQNVVDLTHPGFDGRVLSRLWKLPDIKFSHPMDAILTLIALKTNNHILSHKVIENPKDQRYFGPVVALMSLSQFYSSGSDLLLAQARSLGLHICTWLDDSYYDRRQLADVIQANSAGLMATNHGEDRPRVWYTPSRSPIHSERPKGLLRRLFK